MRAINVTDSHISLIVKERLSALRPSEGRKSWRTIAREFAMPEASAAMLARIARGTQKPPDSVLAALGLPITHTLMIVPDGYGVGQCCTTCGEVHTTQRCPTKRRARVRTLQDMTGAEIRSAFENRR